MTWTIPDALDGARADVALSALGEMTRSAAQKLIETGLVFADGKLLQKSAKVCAGTTLTAEIPKPKPAEPVPQNIPLDIVYEDGDVLVVNKPAGLVVHPAAGHEDGTLVNALLYHCGDSLAGINGVLRPGIVHRIDRDTSGLLVVAKNDAAMEALARELAAHHTERVYECVVRGHPDDEGTVNAPVGRHPTDRKKMAVNEKNGKPAVTHYRVLETFPGYAYIECRLETGRTHQIRVHMAHIGHPIVGDPVYNPGGESFGLAGQCLHAKTLCFQHPKTGKMLKITSELPEEFQNLLTKLRGRV
ncbi:MAG: RluA family pseudouridine synthase [Clostridiaceae bacterium]|nr:RluA family pseudouridine synthase [Clostridiaceae bacterium]